MAGLLLGAGAWMAFVDMVCIEETRRHGSLTCVMIISGRHY
jgi:hypothetical protein